MRKIAILLCLLMSLLTVFASCGAGGDSVSAPTESDQPLNPGSDDVIEYSGELAVNTAALKQFDKTFNENHVFSYKTTGTYMVKNGKTSYKVVVPEVETEAVSSKKANFRDFSKRLPV